MNRREMENTLMYLEHRIGTLTNQFNDFYERHNRLMDYLGLEEETEPRIVKLRGAGTPAPSRYTDVTKDQNGGGTG